MAASDLTPCFNQTNLKMLEEQLLCDVIFEAGGERIGAHKFILASRNSTFRYKFLEAPNEIYFNLADKDPNIVWTFFRYLYTGVVKVTATNADALFCMGKEYQTEDLIGKCISVLASSLTPESACMFMNKYHKYASFDAVENCIKFIVTNSQALYTDQLAALPQPYLHAVLASDGLGLPEEEVCKLAMKWAEAQCGLQNLVVTGENQRKVLGDAFFEIRFPIMNKDYFVDHVSNKGILTAEEEKGILLYFLQKKAGAINLPFKLYQRGSKSKQYQSMRFKKEEKGWECAGQRKDAICFLPSVAITLHGIKIYGKCDQAGQLNASVVLQYNSQILTSVTAQLQTNPTESLYDVLFNQPVVLNHGVEYHIICTLEGGKTYFGNRGQETVNENGVEFKFKRTRFSTNNTAVIQGQIPGLIYSL
ncbi:hypothetical protein CHS0354_028887 [Potamilus streckersoni]|uniref:BTB domain-containing protein n=1 Tax=Potamilus streckersoni TaxID=2493646 RepID=A0AAE0SBJ0_9BIVA|nr:hypothetical protein CHS0354_028887 [Potamilus streckersoni]